MVYFLLLQRPSLLPLLLLLVSLLCWHPCYCWCALFHCSLRPCMLSLLLLLVSLLASILAVDGILSATAASVPAPTPAAVGFLVLLASLLLLVDLLPLVILPPPTPATVGFLAMLASLLLMVYFLPLQRPSLLPLLLLLVSLFCWHPCYCCWTYCRW